MKVKLGTGKVVEFVQEYGPREDFRAAELSGASADNKLTDAYLQNYATVMVATVSVGGKTIEDLTAKDGGAADTKEMLLRFREAFTDAEWSQVNEAHSKVFGGPKEIPPFEILS